MWSSTGFNRALESGWERERAGLERERALDDSAPPLLLILFLFAFSLTDLPHCSLSPFFFFFFHFPRGVLPVKPGFSRKWALRSGSEFLLLFADVYSLFYFFVIFSGYLCGFSFPPFFFQFNVLVWMMLKASVKLHLLF